MSDETKEPEPSEADNGSDEADLIYESNEKHRDSWQREAKGSLCDKAVRPLAHQLLHESVQAGEMRYAVYDGRAYCAKEHLPGRWHGHPVGWREVPAKLRTTWTKEKRVSKRQVDKPWKGHA
jgi:hypothetical protein